MQYKIPQDISSEDRLIGPLSLRQLIIVGAGGAFAYLLYISLVKVADPVVYVPPMIVIILLTLAIAFFKKDNLTFTRMVLLFLETVINPPQRLWVNFGGDISPFKLIETFAQADVQKIDKKEVSTEKTIDELDKLVRIIDYDPNDVIYHEHLKHEEEFHGEQNERTGILEKLASEAAKKASSGIKRTTQEDVTDNLYIKKEEIL